jgi:hypothetical protein
VKDDPAQTVLAPPTGEAREILIPKPWTTVELGADLPLDKMHVLKLKLIRPPNAIAITKLDKWFLPGGTGLRHQLSARGPEGNRGQG